MSYRNITTTIFLITLLVTFCCACSAPGTSHSKQDSASAEPADHVILVPDWQNDVVHRISIDGVDEGDFLDRARFNTEGVAEALWSSPRGLMLSPGTPRALWLASVRGMTEWDGSGRFLRTVFRDTERLEVPVCLVRVGDEIFVISEDKNRMLVLAPDGALIREFAAEDLKRAGHCELGPDGLLYVGSRMRSPTMEGLVSIWNLKDTSDAPKPVAFRIPPDESPDGTISVHSLVFDDGGNLLITEFSRGRVERWDAKQNKKLEVLLDSDRPGQYLAMRRGPDGLVYVAARDGLYRFDSRAHAEDLKGLKPFFDATAIRGRYKFEFAPSEIVFVARSLVADAQTAQR